MERKTDLDSTLRALVDRLRALRSAWGVLAPSGLSAEKIDISQTGRTLNDDLMELVGHDASCSEFAATALIEARLDSLETEMRAIAFRVPVSQLRSTLPACVSQNRRGVLDLLDLMLGAEVLGLDDTPARIPSIDYLITLLCSAGSDRPPHDPVQLTPRLHELCERSGVDYDPRLPEIEAEFFHAADMYEAEARNELQLRALRTRKAELGASYFAPQVLRAIVTYNVSLLQRIDEEVLTSQDWGSLPPVATKSQRSVSVFETTALPQIAQALKRRLAGGTPELSAVDRIAWCLDLEYPTAAERRTLLSGPTGASDDLTGTVILVGLLCRSAVVLEDELPAIGTSSTQLFEEWVPELSEALQRKVNRGISGDDFREACMLSELKTRFLYTSMAEARHKNHRRISTSTPASVPVSVTTPNTAGAAKSIIREALVDAQTAALDERRPNWKSWPARRLAAIGVAIAGVLLVFGMGRTFLWNGDLAHFNRDQLDQVSPYLAHGARSQNGLGPAFVGGIRNSWSALEASDRMLVATDLVETLRENGVRDVMIYDDDGFLRIQALGKQPPRMPPSREPEP